MRTTELLEYIADMYSLEDILNILGRDTMWLLHQIEEDVLEHKEDFFNGDESYSEIMDD